MLVEYSVISVKGNYRDNNQDNFFADSLVRKNEEEDVCFSGTVSRMIQGYAVFDGMGGEKDGEIASFIAASTLKDYSDSDFLQKWNDYLKTANRKICDHRKEKEVHAGTTFAGVFLSKNQFLAANIGDSRIYKYNSHEIRRISYDDTEFQLLLNRGEVTEQDFFSSKARNHLTQHLGLFADEIRIHPHSICGTVQKGMRFLLCSDGLYSVSDDSELLNIVTSDDDMEHICHTLVENALNKGSRDNITVMLLHVLEIDEDMKDTADALSVLSQTDEELCQDEFEETLELQSDSPEETEKKADFFYSFLHHIRAVIKAFLP